MHMACVLALSPTHPPSTQVGKVLANDPNGRATFVQSGGLAAVQQMGEAPGSKLREAVEIINSCYPEEIVRYYSPSYSQQLLEKLTAQISTTSSAAAIGASA